MAIVILFFIWMFMCMTFGTGAGTLISVILLVIGVCCIWSSDNKRTESIANTRRSWEENNSYNNSTEFIFKYLQKDLKMIFDEPNKKIIYFEDSNSPKIIMFEDIIGCEIRENGAVTGGIGRAVVGGLIGGGAGAVVGATTAKKKVTSYQLAILCDSLQSPEIICDILSSNMNIANNSEHYQNAYNFATGINSTIKVILNRKK